MKTKKNLTGIIICFLICIDIVLGILSINIGTPNSNNMATARVLLESNSITGNKVYIGFLVGFLLLGIGAGIVFLYRKFRKGDKVSKKEKEEAIKEDMEKLEAEVDGYTNDEIEAILDDYERNVDNSKINFNVLESIESGKEIENKNKVEIENFKKDVQELSDNVMNSFVKINEKMDRLFGKFEEMEGRIVRVEKQPAEDKEFKKENENERFYNILSNFLVNKIQKVGKEALGSPVYNEIRKEVTKF